MAKKSKSAKPAAKKRKLQIKKSSVRDLRVEGGNVKGSGQTTVRTPSARSIRGQYPPGNPEARAGR